MALKDLVLKNRSFRRFHADEPVSLETLRQLVDLARLSASGSNIQPLKYILSCEAATNNRIFPTLSWAGYLKDWPGPIENERPAAYIVILGDARLRPTFGVDPGIAAQSILLGAVEKGLGGCIIASVKKEELGQTLAIPDHFEVLLVLALGVPKETVEIEPLGLDGDIKYWRDADGVHHVPKRALEEIIVGQHGR
ncbi:MAG: nitroreductase family protein [Anaerolineales bacterium]|nr:nitroreductase family protein [Anaerolineales bacterium]